MSNYSVEKVASFLRILYDVSNRPAQEQTASVIKLSFNTRDGVGLADKQALLREHPYCWDGQAHWNASVPHGPLDYYSTEVLKHAPVGYWRLGESSGLIAADSSGNGKHGTYSSTGVTYGVTSPLLDDTDTAVTLSSSGSGQITIADDSLFDFSTNYTIECWTKIPSITVNMTLVSKVETNQYAYSLEVSSTGYVVCRWASTLTTFSTLLSASPIPATLANWTHIAMVKSGSNGYLYINGQFNNSRGALSSTPNASSSVRIGNRGDTSQYLNGSIDEVALYNTALTQPEIERHYAAARYILQ